MDSHIKLTSLTSTMIAATKLEPPRYYNLADYQYEVIKSRIKEFEDNLDDEHEVALKLATFSVSILLNVTRIGYSNPNTLIFHGSVNGEPATLL